MDNELYKVLGENLKARRKALSLTQQDFADQIKVSRVTVCNIEIGKCGTTLETLMTICSVLRCTPNDLLPSISVYEDPTYPIYFNIY